MDHNSTGKSASVHQSVFLDAQQKMLDRYSVEAQSEFVRVPSTGGKAHVLVTGEGPSLVMLNGIGTPGGMWAPLMAELRGFKLHAIDLPGFGLTNTKPGFARDLRHNAVLFLEEVLDELRLDQSMIVSNSLGSLWASWLALDSKRVAALVLIGCPAIVLNTSAPFLMRLLSVRILGRLLTRLQPPSPKQVAQLSKMVREYPLVPELVDLLVATERLPEFRDMFLGTVNALVRIRGNRPQQQLSADQLRNIHQPTLLVWGSKDPFGSPNIAQRIVRIMPDARLHIVDGGHAPWLAKAEAIGPIISEFIRVSAR